MVAPDFLNESDDSIDHGSYFVNCREYFVELCVFFFYPQVTRLWTLQLAIPTPPTTLDNKERIIVILLWVMNIKAEI